MKEAFILLVLCVTLQSSYGQACGIYRIKYVGTIKSESAIIIKMKLPSIALLHNLENKKSNKAFIETQPEETLINVETSSPLTSILFDKPEDLLVFYKNKKNTIPVILIISKNGKEKKLTIEINWDDIVISKVEDKGFGNLFQIDFKEIILK